MSVDRRGCGCKITTSDISIKLIFNHLTERRGEGGDIHKTVFGIHPRYLGDFPFAGSDPEGFTGVQRSEQRNVVVPLVRDDVEVCGD